MKIQILSLTEIIESERNIFMYQLVQLQVFEQPFFKSTVLYWILCHSVITFKDLMVA